MANSMRPIGDHNSDADRRRCKKHPKHRQSPGVCSRCLSEKLSRLSSASSSRKSKIADSLASISSSSSLSTYYSSASSCSSCSSPTNRDLYQKAPRSSLFKKSRSMAFVSRIRGIDGGEGKKIGGFWSKLLGRGRVKQMDEALHG